MKSALKYPLFSAQNVALSLLLFFWYIRVALFSHEPSYLWHGEAANAVASEQDAERGTYSPLEVLVEDDDGVGVGESHPHSYMQKNYCKL